MTITKVGILTKYSSGIHATRNGRFLGRAGKILQVVSRVREMRVSVGAGEKRIEGVRESKNRGPRESGL